MYIWSTNSNSMHGNLDLCEEVMDTFNTLTYIKKQITSSLIKKLKGERESTMFIVLYSWNVLLATTLISNQL